MKRLSQKQVDELAEGTKVTIIWSGGNGPHDYTIHKRDYEGSFVSKSNPNAGWYNGEIDFVGPEPPYTQVWLTPQNITKEDYEERTPESG